MELTLNLFSQNMGSVPQEPCQRHSNIVQTPATSHYFCSSISCPNDFNRLPPSAPALQNSQGTELGGDGVSATDLHVCSGPSCPELIESWPVLLRKTVHSSCTNEILSISLQDITISQILQLFRICLQFTIHLPPMLSYLHNYFVTFKEWHTKNEP